jgi:hypothetical protein
MNNQINTQAILAILFFILPLIYRWKKRQVVSLTDVARCTLAAMSLPNLLICLYYVVLNPSKALTMAETVQYLTIAVLIIIYVSVLEIQKTFQKKVDQPPET